MNKARDFFLELANFVVIYFLTINFLILTFQIIDRAFPDALTGSTFYPAWTGTIRWAMASLIITYPILLVINHYLRRLWQNNAEARAAASRRWLTYLTLFVAGATLAVDAIMLINSFLGGEITPRFGLKIAVTALATGVLFVHFVSDLRRGDQTLPARAPKALWLGGLFILLAIVSGFFVIGSPFNQRKIQFDEQRISDLQNIQWQILNLWQTTGHLPPTLTALNDPLQNYSLPIDPETGASYEYKVAKATSFELCAIFNLASQQNASAKIYPSRPSPVSPERLPVVVDNWQHTEGHACFSRTIDSARYPLVKAQLNG